ALADMHRDDAVLQSGLLEKDADLVAIGCGPVVQVDHLLASIGILTRLTGPWVDSSACRIRANQAPKAAAPQQTVGRQIVAVARARSSPRLQIGSTPETGAQRMESSGPLYGPQPCVSQSFGYPAGTAFR